MTGASMDYAKLNRTILKKVLEALAIINNPEIAPEVRQLNQEILFRQVGSAVYAKVYDMNAFDFEIYGTRGPGIDDRYYGLAKVSSATVSTGEPGLAEYVKNYLDTMASKAQHDATKNARQSNKHPTVTRKTVGKTCKWCTGLSGTYTDPGSEVFRRHGGCDCAIITEGYKSRNGLLNNYVKGINVNGKITTVSAAARDAGIAPGTLQQRLNRGWSADRALSIAVR